MKNIRYFTFVIILLFNPLIVHGEQYLCICENATGFSYSEISKSWEITRFKETDHKYIISKSDDKKYAYKVTRVGDKDPIFYCEKGFNKPGYLFADIYGYNFKYNKNNGRYILSYLFGYYNVLPGVNEITDKNSNTPFIEIGVCSPF